MKLRVLRTFVAAAALLAAAASQAVIVDFEGAINTSNAGFAPLLGHEDEIVTQGFYIDALSNSASRAPGDLVGAILTGSDLSSACAGLNCPSNNSTTFLAGVNDGLFAIGAVGDALFRFAGFDASFIGAQGATLPAIPGRVRLQGVRADDTTITQIFNLGGLSSTGALSFRSYATTGAFSTTLFKYVFFFGDVCNAAQTSCAAFSNDQGQFAIDNINVTAVPEPSTWALMLGGLVAAAAVRRRSIKSNS
jgi:PEP-CTERM motif